eukprot:CAMPEP_0177615516 /NCGR_PEP_ID=MMETSP0419_2-20121207/23494_1 /TAXON_ID=582737 /ORGANISM="Tetraselmis sp., Strain GSL018" /LENGTH=501 /DNA_ID=CAMNT_0019113173 /DNA_START=89 /DNA_END=1594 /DNA_ORIENTATION=+
MLLSCQRGEKDKQCSPSEPAPDALCSIYRKLDLTSLSRCACVCRHWSVTAKAVQREPRTLLIREFGYDFAEALETFIGSDTVPWTAILSYCKANRQHFAHEQHEARCHHLLRSAVDQWRLSIVPESGAEVELSPTVDLRLPQSTWTRFSLPPSMQWDSSRPARVEMRAVCRSGLEAPVVAVGSWRVPQDDLERFRDSHRSGIYAWFGGDGEEEPATDPAGPSVSAAACSGAERNLHIAVYAHFEQLLQPQPGGCGLHRVPLPQEMPVWIGPKGTYIEVAVDFCKPIPGRVGGLRARLACPDGSGGRSVNGGGGGLQWTLREPSDLQVFAGGGRGPAQLHDEKEGIFVRRYDGPALTEAAAMELLSEMCDAAALADFAIYDHTGRLVIGRSGVELWATELEQQPPPPHGQGRGSPVTRWEACFLVDGEDSWDNSVEFVPSSADPRRRVSLNLTDERGGRLRVASGDGPQGGSLPGKLLGAIFGNDAGLGVVARPVSRNRCHS